MQVRSYKPEVQTHGDLADWNSNALRFPTEKEAADWARDLARRWTLVKEHRAMPSEDPPNYTYENGEIYPV